MKTVKKALANLKYKQLLVELRMEIQTQGVNQITQMLHDEMG